MHYVRNSLTFCSIAEWKQKKFVSDPIRDDNIRPVCDRFAAVSYWFSMESSRTGHCACVASLLAAIKRCGENRQQS